MKQEMKCPLCKEKLFSRAGNGCMMCGMPLESKKKERFCSRFCREEYRRINKHKRSY